MIQEACEACIGYRSPQKHEPSSRCFKCRRVIFMGQYTTKEDQMLVCSLCGSNFISQIELAKHREKHRILDKYKHPEAKRIPSEFRFDILDPSFLRMMAKIAAYGAEKYGDFNWHKSRLTGDKGPINHILKHVTSYILNEPYDHLELGEKRKLHLAAVAFNAMMEFWYEEQFETQSLSQKMESTSSQI